MELWQLLTFEVDLLTGQASQDGETRENLPSVEGLIAAVELRQRLLYERYPQLFAMSLVAVCVCVCGIIDDVN